MHDVDAALSFPLRKAAKPQKNARAPHIKKGEKIFFSKLFPV